MHFFINCIHLAMLLFFSAHKAAEQLIWRDVCLWTFQTVCQQETQLWHGSGMSRQYIKTGKNPDLLESAPVISWACEFVSSELVIEKSESILSRQLRPTVRIVKWDDNNTHGSLILLPSLFKISASHFFRFCCDFLFVRSWQRIKPEMEQ